MAVNHADMTTMGAFLCSPFIAGKAAIDARAGWYTVGFVVLGLLAGVVVAYAVRKVAYASAGIGVKLKHRWTAFPFFVGYMVLPPLVSASGLIGIYWGTGWVVRHML